MEGTDKCTELCWHPDPKDLLYPFEILKPIAAARKLGIMFQIIESGKFYCVNILPIN